MSRLQVTAESTGSGSGASITALCYANEGLDTPDFEIEEFETEDFETGVSRRGTLRVEAEVDATGAEQIQPGRTTSTVLQRVGWYVNVDGSSILEHLTQDPISVSRAMDRAIQAGSFTVRAKNGVSPLGNPIQMGAPITGKKSIEIGYQYMTDQGVVLTEPLLSNGLAETSERTFGFLQADTVNVHDGLARYINERVTRSLPAGSGMSRARFLRLLANDAGVPTVLVRGSHGFITKQVELAKGDWLSLAQAMYDVKGGRILYDRRGNLVVRFDDFERGRKPVRWDFGPKDLVRAIDGNETPMGFFNAPEPYTKVSARGTQQVLRDETCGAESQRRVTETQSVKGLPYLPYQQAAGSSSSITATTGPGDPSENPVLQKVEEIITTTTMECGEIVAEIQDTYGYYRVASARFRLDQADAALPIDSYLACFLETNDTEGPAYAGVQERWLKLRRVVRDRVFDDEGFLVEERTSTYRYYNPGAALKYRSSADSGTPWDEYAQPSGTVLVTGELDGVSYPSEKFILTEYEVVTYGRAGSYLQSRRVEKQAYTNEYSAGAGGSYLWSDGSVRRAGVEAIRVVETESETWQQVDEQRIAYNITRRDGHGALLPNGNKSETRFDSLPAAPRKSNFEPVRANFETDEEFEAASAANQFEQQEITAECSAPNLLTVRPKRELDEAFFEWAEDEGELQDLCTRIILKGQSPIFRFPIMAHGRIEEGDWCRVRGPRGIFVVDGFVRSLDNSSSLLEGKQTIVDLQVYPRALAA